MQRRFSDFFSQPELLDKHNEKPLIKRQVFLSKVTDLMKDLIVSLIFITIFDLTIIGIIALVNRPILDLIFRN